MSFRWIDRKTYIERTAILAYRQFCDAQEFCKENDEALFPSIHVNGVLDNFIGQYSRNTDDITRRTIANAWRDVKVEAYELARLYKNEQAREYFG